MRRFPIAGLLAVLSAHQPASAQKVRNTYGSPLDTIRNTRLTTDVPEAKDFVRETSPDRKTLDYTPLSGVDPVRPKPRDPAGVQALEAQLERAGARNATRATGVNNRKVVVPRGPRAGSAKR